MVIRFHMYPYVCVHEIFSGLGRRVSVSKKGGLCFRVTRKRAVQPGGPFLGTPLLEISI